MIYNTLQIMLKSAIHFGKGIFEINVWISS